MKVSVIIPTYAPGSYLFDCLNCLAEQTLPKDSFEVIIILNGPRNHYYELISEYITKCEISAKLFYTSILGVSNARNIALENITADNIVFIDDDDLVSPDYLEGLLSLADQYTIVASNFKTFRNDIRITENDYLSQVYKKLKHNRRITVVNARSYFSNVCGKLIPIGIIGSTRFDGKLSIGEDSVFMVEISKNVSDIKLANDSVIYYRRLRENSASRKKVSSAIYCKLVCYEIGKYMSFYFFFPPKYNLVFLSSRILASIKSFVMKVAKIS